MICLEERMQQWCVAVWVDTRIKVGCVCVGKRRRDCVEEGGGWGKKDSVDSGECCSFPYSNTALSVIEVACLAT